MVKIPSERNSERWQHRYLCGGRRRAQGPYISRGSLQLYQCAIGCSFRSHNCQDDHAYAYRIRRTVLESPGETHGLVMIRGMCRVCYRLPGAYAWTNLGIIARQAVYRRLYALIMANLQYSISWGTDAPSRYASTGPNRVRRDF